MKTSVRTKAHSLFTILIMVFVITSCSNHLNNNVNSNSIDIDFKNDSLNTGFTPPENYNPFFDENPMGSIDDTFAKISKSNPEFAGIYYSEAGPKHSIATILIKSNELQALSLNSQRELKLRLESVLKKEFGDRIFLRQPREYNFSELSTLTTNNLYKEEEVTYRNVNYSFLELQAWSRALIKNGALDLEGINTHDIDERANSISLGFEDPDNPEIIKQLDALKKKLNIPDNALVMTKEKMAPAQGFTTLDLTEPPSISTNIVRPGHQILNYTGNSLSCGLGFPSSKVFGSNNYPGFITGAHCTNDDWDVNNAEFYYPNGNGTLVGKEYIKSPITKFANNVSYQGSPYFKHTDAAWLHIPNYNIDSNIPFPNPNTNFTTYTNTYSANDDLMSSANLNSLQGSYIYAIGPFNGNSAGYITSTDKSGLYSTNDISPISSQYFNYGQGSPSVWHLGAIEIDADVKAGDSGGPVVRWNQNTNAFSIIGIVASYNINGTSGGLVSRFDYIKLQLGTTYP